MNKRNYKHPARVYARKHRHAKEWDFVFGIAFDAFKKFWYSLTGFKN